MRIREIWVALAILVPTLPSWAEPPEVESAQVERGRYLVTIMDCGGCHTPGSLAGGPRETPLAGSRVGIGVPGGDGKGPAVVYPPNLTPDRETGLGEWSLEQTIRAIRYGQRPDGRMLSTIMPWPQYSHLTDSDARAIAAHLRSLAPSSHRIPEPVSAGGEITTPYVNMAPVESQ